MPDFPNSAKRLALPLQATQFNNKDRMDSLAMRATLLV
jgi:hypothetical protein